jgi:hypothetical protein
VFASSCADALANMQARYGVFACLVHLQTGQSVWYSSKYGKGTYICKTTDR